MNPNKLMRKMIKTPELTRIGDLTTHCPVCGDYWVTGVIKSPYTFGKDKPQRDLITWYSQLMEAVYQYQCKKCKTKWDVETGLEVQTKKSC